MRTACFILCTLLLPIGWVISLLADLLEAIDHDLVELYLWLRRKSEDD